MDMKDMLSKNKNYNWFVVAVDVFTRKGYVYPINEIQINKLYY